jgi:ferredoxin
MPELIPAPLGDLLRRVYYEPAAQGSIFDLPLREFYRPEPELDTSVSFHGLPAGTPLGPAAGPHDQLAQNLALAWLGGSRIMELKTVQILDELKINRPCIEMTNIGFNIEWSQELKLEQSLREYAKGAMIIEIMREANSLGLTPWQSDPGSGGPGYGTEKGWGANPAFFDTIYDMSVGYDLKGIQSPQVCAFIAGIKDATAIIDEQRAEIPDEYAQYRDYPFRTDLVKTATLSTFHGCPKDEIERICRFLLGEMGLHTIIKLNPVQLGKEYLEHLLYDLMGYTHLEVNQHAYEKGLSLDEAVEIVERLEPLARAHGLNIGVKFSNTLEVRNTLGRMPDEVMYLSGPPLHVIAVTLVEEWRKRIASSPTGRAPGITAQDIDASQTGWSWYPITFAAGIDRKNFPLAVALGLCPITVSTDLLKPKGYGRQEGYLRELEGAMRRLGVRNVGDYIIKARGQGEAAVRMAIADLPPQPPSLQGKGETVTGADAGASLQFARGQRTNMEEVFGPDFWHELATAITETIKAPQTDVAAAIAKVVVGASSGLRGQGADNSPLPQVSQGGPAAIDIASRLYRRSVEYAAALNTPIITEATRNDPRYRWAQNRKEPRRIESHLYVFDCISCDKCLPVCPNDANFIYEIAPARFTYRDYRLTKGRLLPDETHSFFIEREHQIANFADFCNECGNCDTFCPEYGGPFVEKPSFFGSFAAWQRQKQWDGFYVERVSLLARAGQGTEVSGRSGLPPAMTPAGDERRSPLLPEGEPVQCVVERIWGRIQGQEYTLAVDHAHDRAHYSDGVVELTLRASDHALVAWHTLRPELALLDPAREPFGHVPDHVVHMINYYRLEALLRGALNFSRISYVNARHFHEASGDHLSIAGSFSSPSL